MMSNHELLTKAHGASEMLDRLLMGGETDNPLSRLMDALDRAWLDEPAAKSTAINAGAHRENDETTERPPAVDDSGAALHSDPTGDAATSPTSPAEYARRDVERRINQLTRDLEALDAHCHRYSTPGIDAPPDVVRAADGPIDARFCVAHMRALGEPVELLPRELDRQQTRKVKLCESCLGKFWGIQAEPALMPCTDDKALDVLVKLLRITTGVPSNVEVERAAGLKRGTIKLPTAAPKAKTIRRQQNTRHGVGRPWHHADDYQLGDNVSEAS